jgi:hypothetical protein
VVCPPYPARCITGRVIDEFGIRQRHLQRGQHLLTMIVSLEATFLSTFVMIGQNGADEKRQVIGTSSGEQSRKRSNKTGHCSACPTKFSVSPRRSTQRAPQPCR